MEYRRNARVVLMNDRDEVFMFLSGDLNRRDPETGKSLRYWVLPGGGLEDEESWEDAALREMWEETGIRDVPLGPCIWTRKAINRASGTPQPVDQRYFLVRVRCGSLEISNANQLPYEREHYTVSRWWSLVEMRASQDIFFPEPLADLLTPIVKGEPLTEPVQLRS